MKLSHFIPLTAIVAGCSTTPSTPPISRTQQSGGGPVANIEGSKATCIRGVETILEFPYGDGLTLAMRWPDSCSDPIGDFLFRHRIERRGELIFHPKEKAWSKARRQVLDVLASRGENGIQEVFVAGKIQKGQTGKSLLLRIDDLSENGTIEKSK